MGEPVDLGALYAALGLRPGLEGGPVIDVTPPERRTASDFGDDLGDVVKRGPPPFLLAAAGLAVAVLFLRSKSASAAERGSGVPDGTMGPGTAPTGTWIDLGSIWRTVKAGDTLAGISLELYGTYDYWPILYDVNRASIGADPDRVRIGTQLVLPVSAAFTGGTFTPAQIECAKARVAAHRAAWIATPAGPTLGPDVLTPCL